jgi:hypothetical protein
VKPLPPSHALQFVDLIEYCASIPANPSTMSPEAITGLKFSPQLNPTGNKTMAGMASAARGSVSAHEAGKAILDANSGNNPRSARTSAAKSIRLAATPEAHTGLPRPFSSTADHTARPPVPPTPTTPVYLTAGTPTTFRVNVADNLTTLTNTAVTVSATVTTTTAATTAAASVSPASPKRPASAMRSRHNTAAGSANATAATRSSSVVGKSASPRATSAPATRVAATTATPIVATGSAQPSVYHASAGVHDHSAMFDAADDDVPETGAKSVPRAHGDDSCVEQKDSADGPASKAHAKYGTFPCIAVFPLWQRYCRKVVAAVHSRLFRPLYFWAVNAAPLDLVLHYNCPASRLAVNTLLITVQHPVPRSGRVRSPLPPPLSPGLTPPPVPDTVPPAARCPAT